MDKVKQIVCFKENEPAAVPESPKFLEAASPKQRRGINQQLGRKDFIPSHIPKFHHLVMNFFHNECVIASDEQFQQIIKAFDNFYGVTGLRDIEEIEETEIDLMIKRRKKHLQEIQNKKVLKFREVNTNLPADSKGHAPDKKYIKDRNFKSFEKYINFLLNSDDPFIKEKRLKFQASIRINKKRAKVIKLFREEDRIYEIDVESLKKGTKEGDKANESQEAEKLRDSKQLKDLKAKAILERTGSQNLE